ncbi:uracil-DNA glycosylase [Phaeobacter gallaeciensis]|uniref:uracil-DNA glycosylase n=1 Tax=Phaeobacter TaxID=302485 RepID=UPI00238053CA|nr:uracil-DNA glycosylase [Phaeobacter gallaeciensis]MDE4274604.1 uracil-DNA glycosylase [Phaeobacter gallaeciensis]MDE4299822.1 uracil-DNA glycosylase [Phaeobacter gallaeciensis]MDE5184987.1 uracil-DNA glycosylase [Phaeobacter gallaeciensis]MEC9311150.1 uracil-DNA glycosylase [Pseudomonadota bacterium]
MPLPDGLGAWSDLPFFQRDWPAIEAALKAETQPVLPPAAQRFAALELTQPADTRVVILGQDPYPTLGHAHGLAFSVEPDVAPLPRSLGNIFKELQSDIGAVPATGDLRSWARQGVLLLNTALSVPAGDANGHKDLGWLSLIEEVLQRTSQRPTAYVFWGKQAQRLEKHLNPGDHLILKTAHPSPLSARRGFFGSRPFSAINTWLRARGEAPIDWAS